MSELVWWVMGVGLVVYVLTGGADFGAGFWHLVASGPRKPAQRDAIEHAIAPIWEANHVWLIFLIVLMFTAYPRAFAAISIAFHIPLVAVLVGIVLRGASFVFRAYGLGRESERARWGNVFAWASAITPIALGAVLAGASSGSVRLEGSRVVSGFMAGWSSAFAVLTGLFALALFALLAAVYLTVDAPTEVRSDFRSRALALELVGGILAFAVFAAAGRDAPLLRARLADTPLFLPLQIGTAASAVGVIVSLWRNQFAAARLLVIAQVTLVVVGWGAAMRGELLLGAVSITNAGGRPETVRAVIPALIVGTALLAPALMYLFRVFKGSDTSK